MAGSSYGMDLQLKALDEATHVDVTDDTYMAIQNHFGKVKKIKMVEILKYIIPYDEDLKMFVVERVNKD